MDKISALILTYNGEYYLEDVILPILKVADEVIVIDSGSSDSTLSILEGYGITAVYNKFVNYGLQCIFGVSQCRYDKILVIDQDEVISDKLIEEILRLKADGFSSNGYYIKRDNYLFGKHIRFGGWGNDYVIRLFDRAKGKHTEVNFSVVEINGSTEKLNGTIRHYPYRNTEEYISKIHSYASISAEEMYRKGKKSSIFKMFFRAVWRAKKKYLLQLGFMDGTHGLILSVLSFYAVFIKYLKLWELWNDKRNTSN